MTNYQFSADQFVTAGVFNTAVGLVSGSIEALASGNLLPGLIHPETLSITPSGLSVTVTANSPFQILFGNGACSAAHGTTNGSDSQTYTVSFSGVVPGAGTITAYLLASYAQVQQSAVSIVGPPPGHPDYNPNFQPYTAYTQLVDSFSLSPSVLPPDNISTFELCRTSLSVGATGVNLQQSLWRYASPISTMGVTEVSGSTTLVSGAVNLVTGSGTYTLPNAGLYNGVKFTVSTLNSNITINTTSSQLIYGLYGIESIGQTSTTLTSGSTVTFLGYFSTWRVFSGNAEGLGIANGTTAGSVLTWPTTGAPSYQPLPRRIPTSFSFYVNASTGTDTTTGGTLAAPWRTLQYARNFVQNTYDIAGNAITFNCAGAFVSGLAAAGPIPGQLTVDSEIWAFSGASSIAVSGTTAITFQFGAQGTVHAPSGSLTISAVGASTAYGVSSYLNSFVQLGSGIVFGSCTGGQIAPFANGEVAPLTSYVVGAGTSAKHLYCHGQARFISNVNVFISGTPTFTDTFAYLDEISLGEMSGTYTGAISGTRFFVVQNSFLHTGFGSGATNLPGTAGASGSGGLVD